MTEEWRLTVDVSDQPGELRDLLVDVELSLGAESVEKVASVESFGVGFDVYCMFGFVNVTCESGMKLLLYTDGAIHDPDDVRIGRHDLTLRIADGRQSLARKR